MVGVLYEGRQRHLLNESLLARRPLPPLELLLGSILQRAVRPGCVKAEDVAARRR